MSVQDQAELLAALRTGDFDRVLGTPESAWVDFKKQPYALSEEKGRWELAKDVAALANAEGGLIVVGYKTARSSTELEEKADHLRRVPKDLVDRTSHVNALARFLYPDVVGIRFTWFPEEGAEGILVIEVPEQSSRDRPFMVNKLLGEDSNPTIGIGIPVREGAETRWTRAERLHALLTRGWAEEPSPRPSYGEAESRRNADLQARAKKRLDAVSDAITAGGSPAYILQAVPPGAQTFIRDLHDEVRQALENPASIRGHVGFNLKFAGPLEAVERGLVSLSGRHALWVDRDGLLTYGVNAGPDFLGWGVNERAQDQGQSIINSLALVESTLEFFRTVYAVLGQRTSVGRWAFNVVGRGWQRARVSLAPGPPDIGWREAPRPASEDNFDESFVGEGMAGRDAALALQCVYGVFGLALADIPFVEDGAISEEAIRARSRF